MKISLVLFSFIFFHSFIGTTYNVYYVDRFSCALAGMPLECGYGMKFHQSVCFCQVYLLLFYFISFSLSLSLTMLFCFVFVAVAVVDLLTQQHFYSIDVEIGLQSSFYC